MAIQVSRTRNSTSGSNWSLILNAGGVDGLNTPVHPTASFGTGVFEFARDFPPESFARVYTFGPGAPVLGDSVPRTFTLDAATLNPSSARVDILGDDLLRANRILMWALDDMSAVVPLTVDADLPNLSEDPAEALARTRSRWSIRAPIRRRSQKYCCTSA